MYEIGTNIAWVNRRISTARLTIGEVRYQPGGRCGPRIQPCYELVHLHSGSCRATIGKTARELAAGMIYLFLPGHRERWEFSPDHETHHTWCEIKPAGLPGKMQRALRRAALALPPSLVWKHLFSTALELRNNRNPAVLWEIDFLGLALFAEFLNIAEQSEAAERQDEAVHKVTRYMQDHLGEEDCLLASQAAAGLSRNVVIRRFQAAMQTTPARHLWRLRTERGIAMLGETGQTVAEIAYLCGFKNPFHFSRMVKQLQGRSPRKIRQDAWRMDPKKTARSHLPCGRTGVS